MEYKNSNGYDFFYETLHSWGVKKLSGVTGGGIVHFLSGIEAHQYDNKKNQSFFFQISEYLAGFVPLGSFLYNHEISAAVATTGAASKLILCGMSDAKVHNLPAIYIIPYFSKKNQNMCPIQDTSANGNNLYEQVKLELPNGTFILEGGINLQDDLRSAKQQLDNFKPVVFFIEHSGMNELYEKKSIEEIERRKIVEGTFNNNDINQLLKISSENRRITFLVGEEVNLYPKAKDILHEFSSLKKTAIIWSINGANSVSRDNEFGYGYVSFGGNDNSVKHLLELNQDDLLIVLGACPDEYTTNMKKFKAGVTIYVTGIDSSYGEIDGSFQHHSSDRFYMHRQRIDDFLKSLLDNQEIINNKKSKKAPNDLNNRTIHKPSDGKVDIQELYVELDKRWPNGSIGFDDICLAYKDRQYVTQRPNENIRFFSLYRGSAMGGAMGLAIGAALESSSNKIFVFSGDGCFRLFAGSLGEIASLGIVLFIFNNESLGIVEQGIDVLLPDLDIDHKHTHVKGIDYCKISEGFGWTTFKMNHDLSNIDEIFTEINNSSRSVMIEVPVDAKQIVGLNPRANNL